MIFDTMMGCQELDMLECRLVELERIPNLIHVVVEADVDHQNNPKPFHFTENRGRFERWADRLRIVRASDLPTGPDPWAREHAQREHVVSALSDAAPDDVILHGDIDEIPTVAWASNVRPHRTMVAGMAFHPFAVDWLHPMVWPGTVATYARNVSTFARLRDARLTGTVINRAGWHFSWVGTADYAADKLRKFCHPEVAAWSKEHIDHGDLWRHGYHVDGTRLAPVDVDHTWPRWVRERRCPDYWFRPDEDRELLDMQVGQIMGRVSA